MDAAHDGLKACGRDTPAGTHADRTDVGRTRRTRRPVRFLECARAAHPDATRGSTPTTSGDGTTTSTIPKLKELKLEMLTDFERWCEIDGRPGEQIMFPQLEKLVIGSCTKLKALPEAPLLPGDHTSFYSAFPKLTGLKSLKSWGVTEGTDARIEDCPELTSFPEAPKLSALDIKDSLNLTHYGSEIELPADLVDGKEKRNYKSPLSTMNLEGCNFFFRSSALALWKCFVQLQDLSIHRCDGLVHWPEREFQSLVSLRTLGIYNCSKLTGYAQPPDQSASQRSQLLPCLQSLMIDHCESLVEVFDVAASLKIMDIRSCPKLELKFRKQEESAVIPPRTELPSTAVPKLSPSPTELFLPCLQSLKLWGCDSISELLNLPSTLTCITIRYCDRLRSLESCSGELPSLKSLQLYDCPGIKSLARCLQQRLHGHMDSRFEGPRLSKPKTWKYAISRDW